jgi:hypothetical protein
MQVADLASSDLDPPQDSPPELKAAVTGDFGPADASAGSSADRHSLLRAAEARVLEGQEAAWLAMREIHDLHLYLAGGFTTFGQYVTVALEMSPTTAYRWVDAGEVARRISEIQQVSPMGETPRLTERVARELAVLLHRERVDLFETAVHQWVALHQEAAGPVGSAHVRDFVQELLREKDELDPGVHEGEGEPGSTPSASSSVPLLNPGEQEEEDEAARATSEVSPQQDEMIWSEVTPEVTREFVALLQRIHHIVGGPFNPRDLAAALDEEQAKVVDEVLNSFDLHWWQNTLRSHVSARMTAMREVQDRMEAWVIS